MKGNKVSLTCGGDVTMENNRGRVIARRRIAWAPESLVLLLAVLETKGNASAE